MYILNDNYSEGKEICDSLFEKYKSDDFIWCNQSFVPIANSLFKIMHRFLPTSSYNKIERDVLDQFFPKALQWCSSGEIPENCVNIDISKCYSTILIDNNMKILIYTIFDDIRKFNDNYVHEEGEFYIDEIEIEKFGQIIKIENGFYH